jgi:nucleotide-binding universal stress UspA family protein
MNYGRGSTFFVFTPLAFESNLDGHHLCRSALERASLPLEQKMTPYNPQIKKILFTTDMSRQAAQAFDYAVGLASQFGAGLTTLYVIEDTPQVHGQDFRDFLGEKRWAEVRKSYEEDVRQILIGKKREGAMIRQALGEMLASAQDRLGGHNRTSDEIVVTQGDVVDCIVNEVRSRQIDLIVMGYHAKGRLEAALAGSVSRSVLRKVEVPVLMVKLPEGG